MKAFIALALLVSVFGGATFDGKLFVPQIGESCEKNPTFVIDTLTITPWPIKQSSQYLINIGGKFTEKEYVEQIYVGTRQDRGFWHYTYQTVRQEYQKNSIANFTVSLEGPSERGAYTDQVSFHRHDFSYAACWQYDYNIT